MVRGRTKSPKTSSVMKHQHTYLIDGAGNGRTAVECHPENPNICHSHEIRNYVVQHQASECYPNCTGIGAPGLPSHGHEINSSNYPKTPGVQGRPIQQPVGPQYKRGMKITGLPRRTSANLALRNQQANEATAPDMFRYPTGQGVRRRGRRVYPQMRNYGDDLGFDDFNPDTNPVIPPIDDGGNQVFNSEMNRAKRALDGEMAGPESSGNTGGSGGSGNTGGSGGGNYGGGY